MEKVSVSIDGREYTFPAGKSIKEAAEEVGIYIPGLCHHRDLTPVGMCRLCIVEIDGWQEFPLACMTPVEEGMKIKTKTDTLQEMRRHTMELILSLTDHPVTCLFCSRRNECRDLRECMRKVPEPIGCRYCPKDGECEIQDIVDYLEMTGVRYAPTSRAMKPIIREPFFDRNYNLCVLCGRCVRVCHEVRGQGVLNYRVSHHRGHTIEPFSLKESGCAFCGACVDVCPTGALYARFEKWLKPERTVTTTCPFCGVGCQIDLGVSENRIVRVRGSRSPGSPNNGQLCVKGRFGLTFAESPERLKTPLLRTDEGFKPVSWDEALKVITEALQKYRGKSFGMLSSARCTNEENYLAQKFARLVMKSNNIDHCARLCHAPTVAGLREAFGSGAMTNSIDELAHSGCIFVIGSNTTEQHPVIALKIKEAKRRGGKLIVADPRKIELAAIADIWLRHNPGTDVALILGMCKVIVDEGLIDENFVRERCEGFEDFASSLKDVSLEEVEALTGVNIDDLKNAARMYATRRPSSIVYAMGITQHASGTDNVLALANLAMLTGNVGRPSAGINPLRGQNNVQGSCDMGALPDLLPGYKSIRDPEVRRLFEKAWGCELPEEPGLTVTEMFRAIEEGEIRAMYIIGENPVLSDPDAGHVVKSLKKLEFLVVQDIFLSETAQLAHVVLPAASALEKEGTFTNTERKVLRVRKALEPPGNALPDWEIICKIARKMGHGEGFSYESPEEVMREIASLTRIYGGISYDRLEKQPVQWPCPHPHHPGTPYLHEKGFMRGKGKFHPLRFKPSPERPNKEYPFILTTGRILFHYHTGTMTRKVHDLNYLRSEEWVEINPLDAQEMGIRDGEYVEVSSRRGKVRARAKITDRSPRGVVFMTFHFSETPTNNLTGPLLDPVARIPELKVCPVRIQPIGEV